MLLELDVTCTELSALSLSLSFSLSLPTGERAANYIYASLKHDTRVGVNFYHVKHIQYTITQHSRFSAHYNVTIMLGYS